MLKLVNEALQGNLVQTTHSGDDPMWNEPLTNRIELNNIPYIQSFAFVNGGRRAVVVFNLHRTSALDVTFSGANAPSGGVTMNRLTSVNITDSNENAENVVTTTQNLTNFNPAQPLSLPPYSMTVLIANPPEVYPTGLVATGAANSVSLAWNAASGAISYNIYRSSNLSNFGYHASTVGTVYNDSNVSPNTSYLYRVRAFNGASESIDSNVDLATTVAFTNPLQIVMATHFTELRTAVNAVRALAGLGAYAFTDASLLGAPIRAAHVTELRNALNAARSTLGLSAASYTDATPTLIKAAHVTDVRNGVQ